MKILPTYRIFHHVKMFREILEPEEEEEIPYSQNSDNSHLLTLTAVDLKIGFPDKIFPDLKQTDLKPLTYCAKAQNILPSATCRKRPQ